MPAPTTLDPYAAGAHAVPEEAGRSLAELLAIVRRRAILGLAVFVMLLIVSGAVAVALPAVYRSTATILIKEQEIPQEFVRSTVTSFADERLQVISQQVMTRATLLDLVDRYGLYGRARQRDTSEEILDRMRRDIRLTPISAEVTDRRTGSPAKATIAFSLSYDSESAASAQKITNELTTLFLNENVKNRQQKAAETTSFLDAELARVGEHISDLEQQLSTFKRRNQGRTPDLNMANLVGSEKAEIEQQRIEREIAFLRDRQQLLESQLADTKPNLPLQAGGGSVPEPEDRLRALQAQLTSLLGQYSDSHPDVRRVRREIASLQAETGVAETAADREAARHRLVADLDALRQRYAEEHPDVARVRRALQILDAAPATGDERRARKPDNPAWTALQTQLATTRSQLESLRAERLEVRARFEQLTARLSQTPEVEREYLELARDMDVSRARFRELRDKQMQAQVAEELERTRKAERFTIIEPPVYPERPYRPNRQLIVLMGAVLAVAGGLAAIAMAQALDQTVQHPRDLTRLMQAPVLAVLPQPPAGPRRRGWMLGLSFLALLLAAVAVALALFHAFVMPIDVAWFGLVRRMGA